MSSFDTFGYAMTALVGSCAVYLLVVAYKIALGKKL